MKIHGDSMMDKFGVCGRLFFATALVAFGVQQFIYGDFVPGRAPAWPTAIPGRLIWAYFSGVVLVATGVAIATGIKARWAAIVTGTMIFLWALLRHLPNVIADPNGLTITSAGKALALFGGAFAVAGSLPHAKDTLKGAFSAITDSTDGFLWLGRICLGVFLIISGTEHFIYTEFVASLVPGWIPGHYFWTYFAGIALIAGGFGIILPKTTRLAAALTGLMIFLWLVLLHIPRALAAGDALIRNEWTAVFEALAMSGIAFVLAGNRRVDLHDLAVSVSNESPES